MDLKHVLAVAMAFFAIAGMAGATINEWEYSGGSIQNFHNFIDSHGPGTYILTGDITVGTSEIIDNSYITIETKHASDLDYGSPRIRYTSNTAEIALSGQDVVFRDVAFTANSPHSYAGVLLKFYGTRFCKVEHCDFVAGHGTAIGDWGSFGNMIIDPDIALDSDGNNGCGILLTSHAGGVHITGQGYGRGIYNGGAAIIMNYAEGILIESLMSYHCANGLYIQPTQNSAILNIVCSNCNFDTTHDYGCPVTISDLSGNFKCYRLIFNNCWMYSSSTGGPAYNIQTDVEGLSIVSGYAVGGSGFPWYYEKPGRSITQKTIGHVIPNAL